MLEPNDFSFVPDNGCIVRNELNNVCKEEQEIVVSMSRDEIALHVEASDQRWITKLSKIPAFLPCRCVINANCKIISIAGYLPPNALTLRRKTRFSAAQKRALEASAHD